MSKLILPSNIEFNNYKGFVMKVEPLDKDSDDWVGIAVPIDKKLDNVDQFVAEGKSRNEVGQKLEKYVDVYRKSRKQKLTIN